MKLLAENIACWYTCISLQIPRNSTMNNDPWNVQFCLSLEFMSVYSCTY